MLAKLKGEDIELNWTAVARLLELSYRCTLCRRCAQACPIGVDNGLIAHEIRKLFSMEMGIAPKEIHDKGSVQQLAAGSSTGMNSEGAKDSVSFIDEEMSELAGRKIDTPWDKHGADVLLLHNAGEFLAWPENPGAFALILEAAGISWTLSSELAAYDAVNYGVWYDDVQFARVAMKQMEAAKKLGVKKILIGECGHAHKALTVIADRLLPAGFEHPARKLDRIPARYRYERQAEARSVAQRFSGYAARSLQPCAPDGHRRTAARDPAEDMPAVPRNEPARSGQLLLRRRIGFCDHVALQLPGLAAFDCRKDEAQADPRRLLRLPGPRRKQICVRSVFQLQGTAAGSVPVLWRLGEIRDPVRRAGGIDRQCHA